MNRYNVADASDVAANFVEFRGFNEVRRNFELDFQAID